MFRRIFWLLNQYSKTYAKGMPSSWVTYLLLSVNGLVFIAMEFSGGSTSSQVLINFGAMFGPYIEAGQYWRLFTAIFIHVGWYHLVLNSIGIFIFGRISETLFGPYKFILIYVLAGLFGAVASYIFSPISVAAGASGALLGLVGALSGFFLTMYKDPNARKNLYGLLFLVAINLLFGLAPGIDNWAHIGGLVTGFFLGYFLTPVSGLLHPGFEGFYVINKFKNSFTRYAAILIVVFAILGGIWLGNSTLPTNSTTEVLTAEKLLKDRNYTAAIKNIEKAIELGTLEEKNFVGRAYFLRALIMVEYGNLEEAKSDLGSAILIADSETRSKSIELLTELNN